ncbi:MAG: hypothetical protein WC825_11405 [Gallionellaceae bacterium]|jgi:hypothetical protein
MSEGSLAHLGHGSRLSDREYEKRIVALHSGLPPSLTKEEETKLRRRELNLTIDHRLGQDFPQQRREALWAVQQRVEKKRFRLIFYWLFHFITYKWLYARANKLAEYLVDEYAKVLTKDELQAFFGLGENERPTLPIDKPYL